MYIYTYAGCVAAVKKVDSLKKVKSDVEAAVQLVSSHG